MREIRLDFVNKYTLVRDTFRNLWVIILAGIIGFVGVRAYYNMTYVPQYKCYTTIAIGSSTTGVSALSNLNTTIDTATTFQEMFKSSYFREKLEDILGEPVNGTIGVEQVTETNLLTISYTSGDPISAYKVLVGIVAHYDEITDHSFSDVIMNTIVEPFVPTFVSNPISYGNRDLLAAAALMLVSLFFIVVTSYFRDTVKNDTDVNEMLDTKLFSVIYHENKNKTLKAKLGFVHSKDPLLILNILINYRFVEAFKVAALKVEYLIRAKNVKTLMITSCGENEGKSTVSVNLALSLAKIGLKVLLIDADLRKPAVYKFFKSSVMEGDIKGLGEILNESVSINDTIMLDKESGLYLMISDKKYRNSSELFTANKFQKLLDSLKNQFDIILLDTAPTSLVSDAEIIASNIDSALIVVRQDIAPVPEINDMIEMISDSGATVEGCIFNDVRMLPSVFNSNSQADAEKNKTDKEVKQ